jgi:hypothetical protein
VGQAVARRSCRFPDSRLYDAHFTHGYRQGSKAEKRE